jgi:soluble lytic murein transglycosylase
LVPARSLLHLPVLLAALIAGYTPLLADSTPPPPPAALITQPSIPAAPAEAPAAEQVSDTLARAEALRGAGEREAALAALQPLLGHQDPALRFQAQYRAALLQLELGDTAAATAALESLVASNPQVPNAERAAFLLGLARGRSGDCAGANAALQEHLKRSSLLEQHVAFRLAACYGELGDTSTALDRLSAVLQPTSPRLLRIEALERQAALLEKAGDPAGALNSVQQIITLGRDPEYLAGMRNSAARLLLELGRRDEAIEQLLTVVTDFPSTSKASAALDRLNELDATDRVSFYLAGIIRFFGSDYQGAQRNLDGSLASPSEARTHSSGAYFRAIARLRQGAEREAVVDLLAIPGAYPTSRAAPEALFRAGRLLEGSDRLDEAVHAYRRAATEYPESIEAGESLFRLGFVQLQRGAMDQAIVAWKQLGESGASDALRSLGLLWQGKAEALGGDAASARARWQQAVDLAPSAYGGARARGMLEGNGNARVGAAGLDVSRLELTPNDLAELGAWTRGQGIALEAVQRDLARDPAMLRADELLALGLENEASWEFDDLAVRANAEPPRLAALALAIRQRGQHGLALRYAQRTADAAKLGPAQAPLALRKILYPLPYAEQFQAQSQQRGIDPLLFAALVRQESHFDPAARSSANAVGLAQVVPSTAEGIARALGRSNFNASELVRPAVSIEFGAYYLADRLRRYGGAAFPALAAYNAGASPVDRWLQQPGSDDADLFAERIPYAETNKYVKVVYENYAMYRSLYGA